MKSVFLFAALVISISTTFAENRVYLQCPVAVPPGSTDSFQVQVYLTNDVAINSITMTYHCLSDNIKFLSASPGAALLELPYLGTFYTIKRDSGEWLAVIWGIHTTPPKFQPHSSPAHTFTLWMQATNSYAGECVNIDTGFYYNLPYWQWFIDNGPTWIYPPFTDCGNCDIMGLVIDCGDADGSAQIDVTDAVYLVNYIFAGGPAPADIAGGDYDCNNQTDITDAVFMINYIFANGPPPCNGCP
ncbi:MAG: dockerin type I domain-containing protein [Candidatus Zixiibacteriota bacterium]